MSSGARPGCPIGRADRLLRSSPRRTCWWYVGQDFHIRGETRLPLLWFDRVEVTPSFPLFADVVAHTTGRARLTVLGLFKDQARQLADHRADQVTAASVPPIQEPTIAWDS